MPSQQLAQVGYTKRKKRRFWSNSVVLSFGVLPQLVAKSSAKRADCALARADGVAKGDDIIGGVIKGLRHSATYCRERKLSLKQPSVARKRVAKGAKRPPKWLLQLCDSTLEQQPLFSSSICAQQNQQKMHLFCCQSLNGKKHPEKSRHIYQNKE